MRHIGNYTMHSTLSTIINSQYSFNIKAFEFHKRFGLTTIVAASFRQLQICKQMCLRIFVDHYPVFLKAFARMHHGSYFLFQTRPFVSFENIFHGNQFENGSPPLQHLRRQLCCLRVRRGDMHRQLVTRFGVIRRVQ